MSKSMTLPDPALARGFILMFDEVARAYIELAALANRQHGRLEQVGPLLKHLEVSLDTLTRRLLDVNVSETPALRLWARSVRESRIVDEVLAFETFLNSAPETVSDEEKQKKTELVLSSLKRFLHELVPNRIKRFVGKSLEVIDEVTQP